MLKPERYTEEEWITRTNNRAYDDCGPGIYTNKGSKHSIFHYALAYKTLPTFNCLRCGKKCWNSRNNMSGYFTIYLGVNDNELRFWCFNYFNGESLPLAEYINAIIDKKDHSSSG